MHYETEVNGKTGRWGTVIPTKEQAMAMREDGIDVIEVHNVIPDAVADAGLSHIWCWFQDIWSIPSRWWPK